MRRSATAATMAGFFCVALLASGCASGPPAPLLSPIEVGQDHGYSEVALGGDRYQVTYVVPPQRSGRSSDIRAAAIAAERKLALDMVAWRAAQLALAHGYAGFKLGNINANVNTYDEEPAYLPPPWWGPGGFRRAYYGDLGPYWEPSPFVLLQVDLSVDVTLEASPGPGADSAQATIERLRQAYPGVEAVTATPAAGS
ncbi:MAG: hypothetical protein JWL84_3325 [Rhodospirillales bacterium]|jgi:hypothetical protein|nr:hypothetical protein [Rhodospirillales bacterium]